MNQLNPFQTLEKTTRKWDHIIKLEIFFLKIFSSTCSRLQNLVFNTKNTFHNHFSWSTSKCMFCRPEHQTSLGWCFLLFQMLRVNFIQNNRLVLFPHGHFFILTQFCRNKFCLITSHLKPEGSCCLLTAETFSRYTPTFPKNYRLISNNQHHNRLLLAFIADFDNCSSGFKPVQQRPLRQILTNSPISYRIQFLHHGVKW